MLKLKNYCNLILLTVTSLTLIHAQDTDNEENFYAGLVSKMVNIPNSPEAQAFAKYGDTEVSLYTGVPQISVPLHTIEGREMNLPVSLTYDASGIKVEQKATPVGLGWNLNVGGRITRMANGLPDDYSEGQYATIYNNVGPTNGKTAISGGNSVKNNVIEYIQNGYVSYENPVFSDLSSAQYYFNFLYDINNNFVDTQPDYFSLNAPGLSETIVIDYNDGYKAKAMNNPRLKITPTLSNNNKNEILGWSVEKDDGTIYEFDYIEYSQRQNTNDLTPQGDFNTTYGSSWLLSKIISRNGKDVYDFSYNNLGFIPNPISVSSASVAVTNLEDNPNHVYPIPPHTFKSGIVSSTEEQILSTVKHNGKTLLKVNYSNRFDTDNEINSKYASIDIYDFRGLEDSNSEILRQIEFDNNDYFNLDGLSPTQKASTEIRLKLNGVVIKGNNGSNTYQTYAFEYERPDSLPKRTCSGQDYFGYYNGKSCDQSLYEKYTKGSVTFPGGDRQPNSYHARTGILNKITYPTQGYSIFKYGAHKESGADIGGIRIESIVDYANTGLPAQTKVYNYSDATINYLPIISMTKLPPDNSAQPAQIVRYATFSKGNEPYVTYSDVTERKVDNNGQNIGNTNYSFFNNGFKGVTPNMNIPFENRFVGNLQKGSLKQKVVSNETGNLLLREENVYYTTQQVLEVPGLVVYSDEALQNQWIFFDTLDDGSISTIRLDISICNEIASGGGTSGDYPGNFWWCPCFISLNDPSCGDYRTEGIFNTFRAKKTQARGQYGGINKVVKEQLLPDNNGDSQTITTTQEIIFTSEDDGYGNIPLDDELYLPRKIITTDSKGDKYETTKFYPSDDEVLGSTSLENKNNLIEEVKVVTAKADNPIEILSEQINEYGTAVVMSPTKVITKKGSVNTDWVEFTYGSNKELKSAKQVDGPSTVYIWGYDNRYPVAKIENASEADLQALASFDANLTVDNGLSAQQELDLRSIDGALVTTYDYEPLIGVKMITDYRGYKTYFEYDDFNRLKAVKDEAGNLLKDYDYAYATPIQN